MSTRPVVLYDANVLYPAQLRDLLMRLAIADLVRAHWSDAIHEEWMRSLLANRRDLTRAQLERTRDLMEAALPGASVDRYQQNIPKVTLPDPDDRHVLAAAVHAGAE
ncbi:PIN domain-containing protein [Salisaeta longa]|uniref:PIN domain-containing protein n=1 Tax=Salisaeta longa TaxID=503170 RepID=UPI001B7FB8F8